MRGLDRIEDEEDRASKTEDAEDEEEGCLIGWTGEDCDACAPGFGGENCAPLPAVAAAAVEEEGCLAGWVGEDCDECAPGYSGEDCTPTVTNNPAATTEAAGSTQKAQPTGSIRTVEFPQSPPVRIALLHDPLATFADC